MYIDISIYIYIEHLHATLHMPQFMISICSSLSVSSFTMTHVIHAQALALVSDLWFP